MIVLLSLAITTIIVLRIALRRAVAATPQQRGAGSRATPARGLSPPSAPRYRVAPRAPAVGRAATARRVPEATRRHHSRRC